MLGFAGTARKESAAGAAGLTTLAGDEFGGGPTDSAWCRAPGTRTRPTMGTTRRGATARRRSVCEVRSEGDTWDITTSVGSTALLVATARALEAQKPDPLAFDPYAELFCRAVGGWAADVLDGKDPDHQLKTADFGEHFVNFQGARTKYFDEYFRRAADAGVRQVVILAAGLDSRGYRLEWPAATTIFELDRPAGPGLQA